MTKPNTPQSMLSQVDSRANHLATPGSEKEQKMTVISGQKCSELLQICNPLGLLVKMLLESSIWRSTKCFLTWKTGVTPQQRLLYRLVPSMPRTAVNVLPLSDIIHENTKTENSMPIYLWPTPLTVGIYGGSSSPKRLMKLQKAGIISPAEYMELSKRNGGQVNPVWVEWLMGFPIGWTDLNVSETPLCQNSSTPFLEQ